LVVQVKAQALVCLAQLSFSSDISAVERTGPSSRNEGQIVQYEVVSNRGKESADRLKVG
jgi:hypothetical protein